MNRWGLYFLVVGLTLSALAGASLTVLYRWQVAPVLKHDQSVLDRHRTLYEDDLNYLEQFDVFSALAPSKAGTSDAGAVLNPAFTWIPVAIDANPPQRVDRELNERLIRMGIDWMSLAGKQKTNEKYNFPLLNQLEAYDHWDVEAHSPIENLIGDARFVPPQNLPIPDPIEILAEAKLNLIKGAQDKSYLASLLATRKLAQLLLSTENIQLVLLGLSVLDAERKAYRYYVDEKKFDAKSWVPVDRNVTRRAHRAILATRGYLRMWAKPEILEKYFLSEKQPFAFCAVVNEAFPLEFSLRQVLEPYLPGEMDFREEYRRLDAIYDRAKNSCRLRYLSRLVEEDRFAEKIPGPIGMNRLPYARKVFGMRLSTVSFGGFEDYEKAATGHNPASD
jgi:hypothetical protein